MAEGKMVPALKKWVDSADGAAVRTAMTVAAPGTGEGILLQIRRHHIPVVLAKARSMNRAKFVPHRPHFRPRDRNVGAPCDDETMKPTSESLIGLKFWTSFTPVKRPFRMRGEKSFWNSAAIWGRNFKIAL